MTDEEKKLTTIAIRFISTRPRLSNEVIKRLQKISCNTTLINQIIENLKKSGYINDSQFISDYILYHSETKLQGPFLIRNKLSRLGASNTDIDNSIKSLLNNDKLISLANQLVAKKTKSKPLTIIEKNRIYRFLAGRGFPPTIIRQVCHID